MQAAGFPAPLVHGFREIEIPAGSFLPPFVPDIPIAGPLNPASWSQEQINAILNPQLLNVMSPNTAANTVAEIPGLGRFSIAIPPVNVEFPWAGAVASAEASGTMNLAASAAGLLPQSFPSFIKYERIPGEVPSHMDLPGLGIFNPANAYENKRQLSVAGDILQNSFDRLNDIVTGSAASGMRPLFAPVSTSSAAAAAPASAAPTSSGGLFGTASTASASPASPPAGPIQALLTNAGMGGGPFGGAFGGPLGGAFGGIFNNPLLQTAEGGSGLVQNIGQGLGQGLLEPVFSIANGSGAGGIVRGILDRAARLASPAGESAA
ncbi:hypothetical protein GNI_053620 [Gregarina niphandrodes]|uniref:Uncharacterized protein n=1 Tax=Gregarina niphandrodes TaxID=110365 RepID=A0A023B955_GRENI|nr:hypothetical protein GNI_053620 [Gregarina niphandrodes]EZG71069.1 hypothetical protein GNI_053620 [Gregarina niphandrodes]|eukprot:XP_011129846.1 hypothetical protein GNI_053620 [Gregarina niphandrodes]